jgi:hypothetical protein
MTYPAVLTQKSGQARTFDVQFDAFKEFEEYFNHNAFSEIEVMKAVDHLGSRIK